MLLESVKCPILVKQNLSFSQPRKNENSLLRSLQSFIVVLYRSCTQTHQFAFSIQILFPLIVIRLLSYNTDQINITIRGRITARITSVEDESYYCISIKLRDKL